MFRRLIMFALGVAVGLAIGYFRGVRDGEDSCKDEIFVLREQLRTVPKEKP